MTFAKNFARFYEKKIILGTSDAWSTSCLSHRPSKPAYHIVDYSPSDQDQLRVPSISSEVLALTWVPPAPGPVSPAACHENFFMSKELLNNFERVWL